MIRRNDLQLRIVGECSPISTRPMVARCAVDSTSFIPLKASRAAPTGRVNTPMERPSMRV
jgi:hypothetical protein